MGNIEFLRICQRQNQSPTPPSPSASPSPAARVQVNRAPPVVIVQSSVQLIQTQPKRRKSDPVVGITVLPVEIDDAQAELQSMPSFDLAEAITSAACTEVRRSIAHYASMDHAACLNSHHHNTHLQSPTAPSTTTSSPLVLSSYGGSGSFNFQLQHSPVQDNRTVKALLQEVGYFDDSDRGTDEDTSSDLSIDDFARQCMAIMDQARQKNGDGFHLRVDEDTWSVLLDDYVHDIVGLKYQDFGAVEQVANQSDINRAVYDVHEMMEREMAPANEHLRLPIQFITIFSFMRLASFAAAYHSLWKQLPDWKESPLRATLLGDDKIRQRYTSRDSHLVILDHDLDEFLESGEVSDPYGDDDSLVALKSLLQVGVWWGKHDNDFLRDLSSRFDHLLFHLKTTCKSFVSKHDPERYLASTFYLAGPRKDFRCYKLAVAQLIYRFRNTPGKEQLVALLRLVLVMWTSNQGFNTVADRVSPVSEDEAAGLHDIEDLPDADEDEKAETRAERDRIAASVAAVKEEFARARREVQARERGERPPLWRQIFDIFDQRFREVIAPYFVVQCQFDDLLKEIMRGLRLF